MKAYNVTESQLEQALTEVNKKYGNNVIWNRAPERQGRSYRFTLRVKDSHGKGARIGFTGRAMVSACWHVHGDFFDALFEIEPDTRIISAGNEITINYGNWEDRNIGSIIHPMYYSEACNCKRGQS